jgi:hypothetical protein
MNEVVEAETIMRELVELKRFIAWLESEDDEPIACDCIGQAQEEPKWKGLQWAFTAYQRCLARINTLNLLYEEF